MRNNQIPGGATTGRTTADAREDVSQSLTGRRGRLARVLGGRVLVWFMFLRAAVAKDIYVAQNTTGSGSGADASDCCSAAWFNTGANWGSGAGLISPGDTVHLVGTITTALTVQSSGTSGNPITILFSSGAIMTAPYWPSTAAINLQGYSYLVVDGGPNGTIQCTANGTALANQVAAGAVNAAGNNITVQNLIITNLYVRQAGATDSITSGGIGFQNSGLANIIIRNNTISWCYCPIWIGWYGSGNANIQIYSNTCYYANWGIATGDQEASSSLNGLYIHHNRISGLSYWDDPSDNNHHDGIFCWCVQGNSTLNNLQVYDNVIGPDLGTGANCTAGIYISSLNPDPINSPLVYNNVLYTSAADLGVPSNGFICLSEVTGGYVLNNTTDATGASTPTTIGLRVYAGSGVVVRNNIFSNNGLPIYNDDTTSSGVSACDYNDYYNDSGDFYYNGGEISYASWQALGFDSHSLTANPLYVNAPAFNFDTQSGSPCATAGTNESAYFTTDIAGGSRPSGSGWSIGAYQYPAPPVPPTGVHVVLP